ncbi:radical SAM protein [Candidatus Sumerlaeota bacterium]
MTNLEFTIDVTYACRLKCQFCSTGANPSVMEMPHYVAQACRDFMRALKARSPQVMRVVLSGGEPLLHDGLGDLLSLWRFEADSITLCTSGSTATKPEYWTELSSCGLTNVRLSLHTVSENACASLWGPEYSLRTVRRNIQAMNQAGLAIDVNYLLTSQTMPHLADVFHFAAESNARKVRVLGLARQGRASANWGALKVSEGTEDVVMAEAKKLSQSYNMTVEFAGLSSATLCVHSDGNGDCLGGRSFFHITTDGGVYPCPGVKSIPCRKITSVLDPECIAASMNYSAGVLECVVSSH